MWPKCYSVSLITETGTVVKLPLRLVNSTSCMCNPSGKLVLMLGQNNITVSFSACVLTCGSGFLSSLPLAWSPAVCLCSWMTTSCISFHLPQFEALLTGCAPKARVGGEQPLSFLWKTLYGYLTAACSELKGPVSCPKCCWLCVASSLWAS